MALHGGQASAMEYSAGEDFGHDLHKIDRAALPPHRRVGGPSLRVLPIAPLGPAIFSSHHTSLPNARPVAVSSGRFPGRTPARRTDKAKFGALRRTTKSSLLVAGSPHPHSCGQAGFGRKVARDTQRATVAPPGHESLRGPNGSYGVEPVRKRLRA